MAFPRKRGTLPGSPWDTPEPSCVEDAPPSPISSDSSPKTWQMMQPHSVPQHPYKLGKGKSPTERNPPATAPLKEKPLCRASDFTGSLITQLTSSQAGENKPGG